MKIFKKLLLATFITVTYSVSLAQQAPVQQDTVKIYFQKLARANKPEDRSKIREGIKKYANTQTESDLQFAMQLAGAAKLTDAADSLLEVGIKRYPTGRLAMIRGYNALVTNNGTAAEKAKLYEEWVKKFPEPQSSDVIYDYARLEVSGKYAKENDKNNAEVWLSRIKSNQNKMQAQIMQSSIYLTHKDTATAEQLLKNGVENAKALLAGNTNPNAKGDYYYMISALAKLLYQEHKFTQALPYATEAYENSGSKNTEVQEIYALTLTATGRGKEALPMLSELVKKGRASADVKRMLKDAYVQERGSETGYTEYYDSLRAVMLGEIKASINKQMVSETAPAFTLVDLEGRKVSLAELKGKVVILDFWATWCGPCKKSFPAMQMAVRKYEKDPNVKFLFIDTWERGANPQKDVKDFIKTNKYTFQVLLDDKTTKVVNQFGITGIPAKFVIDGQGRIRFKLTGFDGAEDAAVEELSAMIETARVQP